MRTWAELSEMKPDLAATGRAMLYGHDVGLAFLATTRVDGGPRVHPICPLISTSGLYGFITPGPKLQDLRRDGRYALHTETFPPPRHEEAFYVTGRAREVHDPDLRDELTNQLLAERSMSEPWPGFEQEALIELLIGTCLVTLTMGRDGLPAGHTTWHDGR